MRPKLLTPRTFLLATLALCIFGGLAYWGSQGFPLPFAAVPSTAGKVAFVWEQEGKTDLYLADSKAGAPTRLTTNEAQESELAFSLNGQQLAFTADDARDGVRQVKLTEAAPGRKLITLTTTQATKEQPQFVAERDIYFLDSGKIARTTTDASDARAIFPTVDGKRDNALLGTLFAEGGVSRFAVSRDGEVFLTAVKRERGEVLAVYLSSDKTLALLGSAEKIQFQALSDGSMVVLFNSGSPLKNPLVVPTPKTSEEGQAAVEQINVVLNQLSNQTEAMEGQSVLMHFDREFAPKKAIPLPFVPQGFKIAPDNQTVAIFASETEAGQTAGLFIGGLAGTEPPQRVFDKPVTDLTWSPDSTSLALISEGALLVIPATGSATPLNITQGKGQASSPVWSPVQPKK